MIWHLNLKYFENNTFLIEIFCQHIHHQVIRLNSFYHFKPYQLCTCLKRINYVISTWFELAFRFITLQTLLKVHQIYRIKPMNLKLVNIFNNLISIMLIICIFKWIFIVKAIQVCMQTGSILRLEWLWDATLRSESHDSRALQSHLWKAILAKSQKVVVSARDGRWTGCRFCMTRFSWNYGRRANDWTNQVWDPHDLLRVLRDIANEVTCMLQYVGKYNGSLGQRDGTRLLRNSCCDLWIP